MRAVFDAIDRLGIRYLVTGSVAASVHGVLRQTHDTDVVLDLDPTGFKPLADALRPGHAIADPIEFGDFAMASVVDIATADKVDLILRRAGPFEASAMGRRRLEEVPGLGAVWVASVEDLILAKLAWSEGTSELQLRDCAQLLRINAGSIDRAYLERWALRLRVADRLSEVGDAT
ncbi:hypothetical protein BH24CHL9_BH24CHL9_11270 [soil metagenome]